MAISLFIAYYLLIILKFDVIWSEILAASLRKVNKMLLVGGIVKEQYDFGSNCVYEIS
jgi:hypothetical protein